MVKSVSPVENTTLHGSAMIYDFDIYKDGNGSLQEDSVTINDQGHKGTLFNIAPLKGITLKYCNLHSSESGQVMTKNHSQFIQLNYMINGKVCCKVQNGGDLLSATINKQEYNFMFIPRDYHMILAWEPQECIEMFELGISLEMMFKCLPKEHSFFSLLEKSIKKNRPLILNRFDLYIQGKVNLILYDMLHCPYNGKYKQLFYKSKLVELLMLELEAYESKINISSGGLKLRQVDIERMYQAREIITANVKTPCSIIDLAHQVGTNDAYLKRHFKEVFGTTVFGYLQELKMKEAKELLLSGKTVAETAHITGYRYVSHFTRAFKRHYGVNPNQIRS